MAAAQLQRQQQQPQAQPLAEPLAGRASGAEPPPSWPPASTRVLSDPTEGARDAAGPVPPWPPARTRVLSDPSQTRARLDAPRTSPTTSHRRAGSGGAAVTRHGGDHISKPGRHPAAALARSPAAAAQLIAAAQGSPASDPSARQQWPWQSSAQPPSAVFTSEASYQPEMLLHDPPAQVGSYGDAAVAGGDTHQEQQPGQPTFIPLAGTGPYLLGQLGGEQAGFRCARVSTEQHVCTSTREAPRLSVEGDCMQGSPALLCSHQGSCAAAYSDVHQHRRQSVRMLSSIERDDRPHSKPAARSG